VSAWTSGLSVAEFACLRAAGFQPVGQVTGNAVLNFAWWTKDGRRPGQGLRQQYPSRFINLPPGRLMQAYAETLYLGRRLAAQRMAAQCTAAGGDGVVAIRTAVAPYPGNREARQFTAAGTAVRAAGDVRAPEPFLAHMSAQDFGKLITSGWIATSIAIGTAVSQGRWPGALAPRRWDDSGRELEPWTNAVNAARAEARDRLAADAGRTGGEGVVLASMDMHAGVFNSGPWRGAGGYCIIEVTFVGTAIAAFGFSARPGRLALPVIDQRATAPPSTTPVTTPVRNGADPAGRNSDRPRPLTTLRDQA